jgi:pyridoxamine 5'-phosphate oxidase
MKQTLPDPLPANPLYLAQEWLNQAQLAAAQPNPNAMVLASVDAEGQPSARVVLCKEIVAKSGFITFYTNYESRKGRELLANRRAAVVFHWDHLHRQVRAEGEVEKLSDAENDAYFRSRPWQSRLGAWASRQSQPVGSRRALDAAMSETARRFGIPYEPDGAQPARIDADVPRPPYWGGFRLIATAVELWMEGVHRIHDRARWTRMRSGEGDGAGSAWSVTRLQP